MSALIDEFGAGRRQVTGHGDISWRSACMVSQRNMEAATRLPCPSGVQRAAMAVVLSRPAVSRSRGCLNGYQRSSFGPSFQPAKVHKARVPPYHSVKKGTESSAQ